MIGRRRAPITCGEAAPGDVMVEEEGARCDWLGVINALVLFLFIYNVL